MKWITKLAAKVEGIRGSALKGPAGSAASPLFLMVGSLRDCAKKDVVSYAKGMAERYVTAPNMARFHVQEDKANHRFLFEIQEGGPGVSVLDGVLDALNAGEQVHIKLASGGFVAIEDENTEMYSLIYPAEGTKGALQAFGPGGTAANPPVDIMNYTGTKPLSEVFPESKKLPVAGSVALVLAATIFFVAGAAFTLVKSGVLNTDALRSAAEAGHLAAESDNPTWQLEKAKLEAERAQKSVHLLKKENGAWTWEIAK